MGKSPPPPPLFRPWRSKIAQESFIDMDKGGLASAARCAVGEDGEDYLIGMYACYFMNWICSLCLCDCTEQTHQGVKSKVEKCDKGRPAAVGWWEGGGGGWGGEGGGGGMIGRSAKQRMVMWPEISVLTIDAQEFMGANRAHKGHQGLPASQEVSF